MIWINLSPFWYKAILRFAKNDSKNISWKKMYKKLICKIAILMKLKGFLHILKHCVVFVYIEHIFLFKNLALYQRWQNTTFKHSRKWISVVTVTEFALVFQAYETRQCMSHRICPRISNKQMCNSDRSWLCIW